MGRAADERTSGRAAPAGWRRRVRADAAAVPPRRVRRARCDRCRSSSASANLFRFGFFTLLYALLGLGLNVVVGFAGLLDLGYVAFYGFGAYAYAILSSTARDRTGRPR